MKRATLKDLIVTMETLLDAAGAEKVERHCLMEDYNYAESLLMKCEEVIPAATLLELGLVF